MLMRQEAGCAQLKVPTQLVKLTHTVYAITITVSGSELEIVISVWHNAQNNSILFMCYLPLSIKATNYKHMTSP